MSEEKLYVVKNDEGKYWDFYSSGFWKPDSIDCIATPIKKQAELVIKYYGGHVVTLIEEPEKVVLTKEQAEIVERAHVKRFPATFIYNSNEKDEELLIDAYVNGYTVKKEPVSLVKVPGRLNRTTYYAIKDGGLAFGYLDKDKKQIRDYSAHKFTDAEITKFGLQDCEKEEVTDDDD